MNITVVGAGNGGTTIAADLSLKGHAVTLFKTSAKIHNENFNFLMKNNGRIIFNDINDGEDSHVTHLHRVTASLDEAFVDSPQLVIIYVQTNYHEAVIQRIAPYLQDNQVVLLEPGYLSTAYFYKYCGHLKLVIAEAESSPIDCRIIAPGEVQVLFKNIRNPVGIHPVSRKKEAMDRLDLLQYNFSVLDSVAEAALHNPNLIVHTIGAIMSIPRIEYSKGDYWMYREVFTPSVWKLVEKLDAEKMALLKALKLRPVPYIEACKFRNSKELDIDAKTVFFDFAQNSSPSGPTASNSRYITEDVPEGLVLMESLAKMLNVRTPVCTALIEVAAACLSIDFRKAGRTVERLGTDNVQKILLSE